MARQGSGNTVDGQASSLIWGPDHTAGLRSAVLERQRERAAQLGAGKHACAMPILLPDGGVARCYRCAGCLRLKGRMASSRVYAETCMWTTTYMLTATVPSGTADRTAMDLWVSMRKAISMRERRAKRRFAFAWFAERTKAGTLHLHVMLHVEDGFDPRTLRDLWPFILDVRLVYGPGLDLDGHVPKGPASRAWTRERRIAHDATVGRIQKTGTDSEGRSASAAIFYATKYITKGVGGDARKSSDTPDALKRTWGTSQGYGTQASLVPRLLRITQDDAEWFLEWAVDLAHEGFHDLWWSWKRATVLSWRAVQCLAVFRGIEKKPAKVQAAFADPVTHELWRAYAHFRSET